MLRTTIVAAALAAAGVAQAGEFSKPGVGTWETTLQPRYFTAPTYAEAYYDTDLDITWRAFPSAFGNMPWDQTTAWAASFHLGGYGWRLPTVDELTHMGGVTLGFNSLEYFERFNDGPFFDTNRVFWTSTTAGPGKAYLFALRGLYAGPAPYDPQGGVYFAWLVHAGSIGAVPEPAPAVLLVAGALVLMHRRRHVKTAA